MTTLQSLAVASVQERGFYGERAIPALARNALLSAQVLRLTEESGELAQAVAGGAPPDEIAAEAADVQIVAYQIAHLCGQRVLEVVPTCYDEYLRPEFLQLLGLHTAQYIGELCRAIRKNTPHMIDVNLSLLWLTLSRLVVAANGGTLPSAVLAKLNADSGRGYLHGEPAPAATQGQGDVQASDLGEEHNVYLDGPTWGTGGALGRALNYHIWQSEEPGEYSHGGMNHDD